MRAAALCAIRPVLFVSDFCAQAAFFLSFSRRWFVVFFSVGPPDAAQSTPRRRKSLLRRGGSSRIRRRGGELHESLRKAADRRSL